MVSLSGVAGSVQRLVYCETSRRAYDNIVVKVV